jgi:VIT1/CCC1 family predicted Fe2+/Mn2+ transporter
VKRDLVRPAVFGASDGMMSLLGVLLYLGVSHPTLVVPAMLSGAVSSAISMAVGDYLSVETDTRLPGALVMCVATLVGSTAPGMPWAVTSGAAAWGASAVVCAAIAAVVGLIRPAHSGRRGRVIAQTYLLLGLVLVVTIACDALIGGGS